MLNKMNRMSLVEQVAMQIEAQIEEGYWPVGEKIPPEMALMKAFDVSRNTLREAIRSLVHAGLLVTKQGSGTIVRSRNAIDYLLKRHIKKSSLLELLDVRLSLEKQAAERAADNRTEMSLLLLSEKINDCQKAVQENNLEKFIEADLNFHKTIVKASENQLLIDLYEPLTEIIYAFIKAMLGMHSQINYEEELHLQLLQAIKMKDSAAAGQYVENYMTALRENVMKIEE